MLCHIVSIKCIADLGEVLCIRCTGFIDLGEDSAPKHQQEAALGKCDSRVPCQIGGFGTLGLCSLPKSKDLPIVQQAE